MKNSNNPTPHKAPPYPALLPWFARRARISETRAKVLWDFAGTQLKDAALTPAEHAKAHIALFIERLGQESGLPLVPEYTEQPDQFAWFGRYQARLGDLALRAGGAMAQYWQETLLQARLSR